MRATSKAWAGMYGVLFHAVVVAVVAWVGHANRAGIPATFYARTVPPFLLAAFVAYVFTVGPYLPRRPTTKGAVLFDSAVGMMTECLVFVLTAFLYSAWVSASAFAEGGVSGYFSALASTTAFALLWVFGSFFTQILVVGNAAGLIGWWVLKKRREREARAG